MQAEKQLTQNWKKKIFNQQERLILAEIWENTVIDGYPVILAKFIPPEQEKSTDPCIPSHAWYIKHVKESQYFLQVFN